MGQFLFGNYQKMSLDMGKDINLQNHIQKFPQRLPEKSNIENLKNLIIKSIGKSGGLIFDVEGQYLEPIYTREQKRHIYKRPGKFYPLNYAYMVDCKFRESYFRIIMPYLPRKLVLKQLELMQIARDAGFEPILIRSLGEFLNFYYRKNQLN